MYAILILLVSQGLYSWSDFLARSAMKEYGFSTKAFFSSWFLLYLFIHFFAMLGQLYAFANFSLGKTSLLFAALSIIMANLLGLLFLGESITLPVYIACSLILVALIILMIT